MILDFLGGMARQGTKIIDKEREVKNQIDLTKKITGIQTKARERSAANARAVKRRELTEKAMNRLLVVTDGDVELAKQLHDRYGENYGEFVTKATEYKSSGINVFSTDDQGNRSVNPIMDAPSMERQKEMNMTVLSSKSSSDEQKIVARNSLEKIKELENIGENTGIKPEKFAIIGQSIEKELTTLAKNAGVKYKLEIVPTLAGEMFKTKVGDQYDKFMNELGKPLVIERLADYNLTPIQLESMYRVFGITDINTPTNTPTNTLFGPPLKEPKVKIRRTG